MTRHDPFPSLRDSSSRCADRAHLESLGKEAAELSEATAISMTDAVVQTLGKTKLNSEEIRRVVEAANHTAFDRKYASLSAEMRVVGFDGGPADPSQVINKLASAHQPEQAVMQSFDYALPPQPKKVASLDFGLGQASPEPSAIRGKTLGEIVQLRSKLSAAQDELYIQEGSARMQMTDAVRDLQEAVRLAVKTAGVTREDLIEAWSAQDAGLVSTALSYMPNLPSRPLGMKVANRAPNKAHPVVSGFSKFAHFARKFAQATLARKDLEARFVEVETFLSTHRV